MGRPGVAKVTFSRELFNEVYLPYLHYKSRYLVFYGGAGSGKSHFIGQMLIMKLLRKGNLRLLLIRQVGRTIRNSQYQLLKDLIYEYNLEGLFKFNDSDMRIKCASGSEVVSAGLDDVEKLKSIFHIGMIWVEETTEISAESFRQLDLRLRGNHYKNMQIILSFNPISPYNWAIKRYILEFIPSPNVRVLKTTYKDNRFNGDEFGKVLEGLKDEDPNMYNIYTLGEIGIIENLIYKPFSLVEDLPQYPDEIIYGLDFGFNNPTAFIEIDLNDREYYLKELLYKTKLTNSNLIEKLKELIPTALRYKRPIYADSAEPARIQEIEEAGFLIFPAIKDVIDGIDYVKSQTIHSLPGNNNINEEVQGYSYKKNRDGIILEDPVKFKDHTMDAIRYGIYTHAKQNATLDAEML